jgi:hypothetical protein
MAITIEFLSASTSGRPISITAITSGTANTIHTSITGVAQKDELFLYANNTGATNAKLFLYQGAVNENNVIQSLITAQDGLSLICPGLVLNSGNAVSAYSDSAGFIRIAGYVQRGP